MQPPTAATIVDLTHAVCPMTTVLALVALNDLQPDCHVVLQLCGPDTVTNVTETLRAHGYRVEQPVTTAESTTIVSVVVSK